MKTKKLLLLLIAIVLSIVIVGCGKKDQKIHNQSITGVATAPNYFGNKHPSQIFYRSKVGDELLRNNPIINVCYIEMNDINPLNAGRYVIRGLEKPFFDIAILFAANIRYDSRNNCPAFWFNNNWNEVFKNYAKYIKPLQDQGIKVLVDLLPDHQGMGYRNMTDRDIDIFTDKMKEVIDKYGFDGYDIDEEYADYGNLHSRPLNKTSVRHFIKKAREKMPDKLFTLYNIGLGTDLTGTDEDFYVGNHLDFVWGSGYGGFNPMPSYPGLTPERYGAVCNIVGSGFNERDGKYVANETLKHNHGLTMMFNLRDGNILPGLNSFANIVYGEDVIDEHGSFYHKDWDAINTPGRIL